MDERYACGVGLGDGIRNKRTHDEIFSSRGRVLVFWSPGGLQKYGSWPFSITCLLVIRASWSLHLLSQEEEKFDVQIMWCFANCSLVNNYMLKLRYWNLLAKNRGQQ